MKYSIFRHLIFVVGKCYKEIVLAGIITALISFAIVKMATVAVTHAGFIKTAQFQSNTDSQILTSELIIVLQDRMRSMDYSEIQIGSENIALFKKSLKLRIAENNLIGFVFKTSSHDEMSANLLKKVLLDNINDYQKKSVSSYFSQKNSELKVINLSIQNTMRLKSRFLDIEKKVEPGSLAHINLIYELSSCDELLSKLYVDKQQLESTLNSDFYQPKLIGVGLTQEYGDYVAPITFLGFIFGLIVCVAYFTNKIYPSSFSNEIL